MSRPLSLLALAASLSSVGCFSDVEATTASAETESSSGPEGTTTTGAGPTSETTEGTTQAEASTSSDSGDTTLGADTGSGTTQGADTGSDSSSSSGEPPPMVCPVFFDTFDDDVVDSRWSQSFIASTSEVGGELVINVTGALNDEFVTMVVLPEDGGLQGGTMRVEIGTAPTELGVRLSLWVQPTEGDGRISYNLAQRDQGVRLEARITPEVGSPQILSTLLWAPDTMQWLQLREEQGQLYFEFSADGESFETFFQTKTPFNVDSAEVGFAGHNDDELAEDVEVSVRSFEFICG